jgi:hypothetical protein
MSLSQTGNLTVANTIRVGYGTGDTGTASVELDVDGDVQCSGHLIASSPPVINTHLVNKAYVDTKISDNLTANTTYVDAEISGLKTEVETTTAPRGFIKNSTALSAGNWYRIGIGTGSSTSTRFNISLNETNNHQHLTFIASSVFWQDSTINILDNSNFAGTSYGIQKIRVGRSSSYDPVLIDVYIQNGVSVNQLLISKLDDYGEHTMDLQDFPIASLSPDHTYIQTDLSVVKFGVESNRGYMRFQNTGYGDLSVSGNFISITAPSSSGHMCNKAYVDSAISNLQAQIDSS